MTTMSDAIYLGYVRCVYPCFFKVLVVAASVVLAAPAAAKPIGGCKHATVLAQAMIQKSGTPGISIGIVKGGRVVCARGYGLRNVEQKAPVTSDTNFHMASISKTFVATAIMQLVLSGKIDLDKPVVDYLPEFKVADVRYKQITVRHLLNHRSGMPDVEDYEWGRPQNDAAALDRYVGSLSGLILLHSPGTKFAYSNIAYDVLGAVIARVSEGSFEDYTRQHIFDPIGMKHSSFAYPVLSAQSAATPYRIALDGALKTVAAYPYNRQHAPSSTLQSNVNDMNRWMISAMSSKSPILPQKGWTMMWSAGPEAIDKDMPKIERLGTRMGLSWFSRFKGRRTFVVHSGSDDGFHSMLALNPKTKTGVVIMTNAEGASPETDHAIDVIAMAYALIDSLTAPSARKSK